ncbi:trigger factor [Zhihengliuella sp.]|uniref:trigger factor n=1 Tax=Zhihengliuella sp. TaxID=1954483 RepID=UPI002812056F|nr:trigger factor [Zhihengliuella sp.]
MKSAVENLSPTRVKLNVEVPLAELQPSIDAAYKSISQQIQVPGFRKGKVPNALIDQRVGRGYVIETAVNESLNGLYQKAMTENELVPLSRPEVEVNELPGLEKDAEGQLTFAVEVDIRPSIELPDYAGLEVQVDAAEAGDEDVQKALDELRGRFGTLKSVDRPAGDDDFLTIDLTATVDGEEVDSAADLSYQVGSGTMLDGMDEAVKGLSAGEDAIFETTLAGGEHSGETAEVKVVVKAVKERELPEANDDFAQLASEFDTIDELKADLAKQAAEGKITEQGVQARDLVLDKLLDLVEVPVPDSVVDDQVEQHFSQGEHSEGDEHDTEDHRAEVRENTAKAFKNELVLDAVAEKEEVTVEQSELIDYIVQTASQYGMDPNQFAQMLDGAGQVPMIVGEVRRRKALAKVLELAKVTDTNGNEVDLTSFVRPQGEDAAESASSSSSASSASAESAE